jgi:hypothetical protein
MPALSTAKEPDFTLVSGAELAEPPDGKVVCAFRALDLDRRHGIYVFILIIDNCDLAFTALSCARHRVVVRAFYLSDIAALTAFELTSRRH